MSVWSLWLDSLQSLLGWVSSEANVGLGVAIIATTILLRLALLPVSWSVAYRGAIRQKKMLKLQPELQQLKDRHVDKPDVYMQKMMALYKKNDLSLFDGKSLLGAVAQMPLFMGMFQLLRNVGDGVRFLWVSNLLKPDMLLAIIAGLTTALMMVVNPDMPEQMRVFMIVIPSVIAVVAALNVCSALSVYWAASNCFSALQTIALHFVVNRRIRSGSIKI